MNFKFGLLVIVLSLFCIPSVFGFKAELDKIVYLTNTTLTVSGTTDYNASVPINATIYTLSGTKLTEFSGSSDSSQRFSFSTALTSYSGDDYYVVVDENYAKNQTLYFKVVEEQLYYRTFILNNNSVYMINTSANKTSANSSFSDLTGSAISISGTVKFGQGIIDIGLPYFFVLVDSDINNTYTQVYIDDDSNFSIYDDTEDTPGIVESVYNKKDIFTKNSTDYIIAGIDSAGESLLVAKAMASTSFSQNQVAYYLIVSEDAAGQIVGNKELSIVITAPGGSQQNVTAQTNASGYYVGSITLSTIGKYTVIINNGESMEFVNVESFTLSPKITDLSDNPTTSFTPGSTARISVISKSGSDLITLSSVSLAITYPNGTVSTASMTASSQGNYYYDFVTPSAVEGSYAVKINATYSGNSQIKSLGFAAESSSFALVAINTDYLDLVEQGGEGVFVDAYAPGKNITILAVKSDLTKGGFMNEDGGALDIENTTASITCASVVSLLELRDDKDKVYDVNSLDVVISSLDNLSSSGGFFPEDVTPPSAMLKQCMIIIRNTTLPAGFYSVKAKLKTGTTEKKSSTSFSIQRLMASGSTVDRNAEDFALFSPNTTVYVKIKLTDMLTKEDLNASQILNAKIIDVNQEYPTYASALSQIANEALNTTTGTLSFVAPSGEGFYSIKFRFKANVSSVVYEGEGSAFFELKKYIIYAEVPMTEENQGNTFQKPGDNISLSVIIVDVDKGSLFDIGLSSGSSQMSCTGCSGFTATITGIYNEQLFKEVNISSYAIRNGSITNSTSGATITIEQLQDFESGFYRVDVSIVNPDDPDENYFGWGFFEIRSFFVKTQEATFNGSVFLSDSNSGSTGDSEIQYETGSPIYILVNAKVPNSQGSLGIGNAEIVNVLKESGDGPMVSMDFEGDIDERSYARETCDNNDPPNCDTEIVDAWITNITVPEATDGWYIVNIRVTTSEGVDIGTAEVSFAAFKLSTTYRDSDSWYDPLYSNDELLNVTFTATNFSDDGERKLNFTTADFLYDKERGKPVKITSGIWNTGNTTCDGNTCSALVNISTLSAGRYSVEFTVNDTLGYELTASADFEVRNYVFAIPQLFQSFNWLSDSGDTGSINLNDNTDRCNNDNLDLRYGESEYGTLGLANSYKLINKTETNISLVYTADNCPAANSVVCWNSQINFTDIPNLDKINQGYSSIIFCMSDSNGLNTGDLIQDCSSGKHLVAIVTNSTSAWIKYNPDNTSGSYNMTGAVYTNAAGNVLTIGPRTWTTKAVNGSLGGGAYQYTDSGIIALEVSGFTTFNLTVSQKPSSFRIGLLCQNPDGSMWTQDGGDCNPGDTRIFVAMNSTHAIASYTQDLIGDWVTQGILPKTNNELAIIGVGYSSTEDNVNYTRIINASVYSLFQPQGQSGDPESMTIPRYYRTMLGTILCATSDAMANQAGQWVRPGDDRYNTCVGNASKGDKVYVFTNSTHVWFSIDDSDMAGETAHTTTTNNVTEAIAGHTWSLASLNVTSNMQSFRMRLSDNQLCGQRWPEQCSGSCEPTPYQIYAPRTDENFAFGRINLITNYWTVQENFPQVNSSRYAFVYHNRTHLFMSNNLDFRGKTGYAIGSNITDSYGGRWMVKSLSDSSLSLKGLNTLGDTGVYINLSLSRSGIVRIGFLRENEFGSYQKEGDRSGLDLDGNGLTNGTLYYVITDANTAGVYDSFFFSNTTNFTNPISVSDSKATRTFIDNADITLTLLSIDPRADRLLFYSSSIGDWADIGDIAVGGNVRVPFIVQKPNGNSVSAATLKSRGAYLYDSSGAKHYISFNSTVTLDVFDSTTGEITINNSNTNYSITSGQYLFEVSGNISTDELVLEEWKLPRANLKAFLTTENMGRGGWLRNFSNITYTVYGDETGTTGLYLQVVDLSHYGYSGGGNVTGVAENAYNRNGTGCINFNAPADAHSTDANQTHESQMWQLGNPSYYFYFSGNNSEQRVWVKASDCDFSSAQSYTFGDYINFSQGDNGESVYMLQVLAINASNESNRNSYALIGANISNTSIMKPIQLDNYDGSGRWRLIAMNLTGTITNALLVNTSYNPICGVWSGECITGAFFTTTGNYEGMTSDDALGVGDEIGDAVPGISDLYISGIGPNSWEAISISDGSQLPSGIVKPVFGNLYVGDNTPIMVKFVNETNETIDLNLDGDTADTFYIIVYDDLQDGTQLANRIVIDDDNYVTSNWQSQSTPATYYDYTGEESGIPEQWGSVPNAIWSGNLMFGPEQGNETYSQLPWEDKAGWNVILFDAKDMLINKESWCGIEENDILKLIVRAYNFNQSNIVGANISISKIYQYGAMSGGVYDPLEYTADSALTDANGYAIVTIAPTSSWDTDNGRGSDYIFKISVRDTANNTATTDKYARIGGECQ